MGTISIELTVGFDGTFWFALVKRTDGEQVLAARHVFGPEPSGAEIREWVLRDLRSLVLTPIDDARAIERPRNPKRLARAAMRATQDDRSATRAQSALKEALAERAQERKASARERRRARQDELRAIAIAKRKKRKRGH